MYKLRPLLLLAALLLLPASEGRAQGTPAGFREEFLMHFDNSMGKFIDLARAMPEDRYLWSPGEGVMSVARVFGHVARYNYLYPANQLGVAAPSDLQLSSLEEITDKGELVALLERSREHVRRLTAEMSDAQLQRTTRMYGRDVQQWAVLLQLLAHMNEHLGQSVAYARMNGVVPPWSR